MKYDVKYAYSAASVAVLYGRLADRAMTERMIETENAPDALKLMVEKGYGITPPATGSPYEYERLILEEEHKVYMKLEELLPEEKHIDFFKVKNDCHNIKVLLKSELSGIQNTSRLNENGNTDRNKLQVMVRERKLEQLPKEFKEAIDEALESYAKSKNPSVIDISLDKACFLIMKKIADQSKNKLLKRIAEFTIDSANIKALIRNMVVFNSMNLLRNTLIPQGSVDESEYVKLFNGTLEQVKAFFASQPLGATVEKSVDAYLQTGSLSAMDKFFDEYYLALVKAYRHVIDGPEPVFYYYVLKEMEMKNMNLVMTGKINLLSKDDIRERLRVYYV